MEQVDYTETTHITVTCKFCGSDTVVKYGFKGSVQYYWCKACKRKFAATPALPGMRYPPDQIGAALNMFYEGLSLNAIRRQMEHDMGVKPSDATVYDWVVRFSRQATEPLIRLSVEAGDVWVIDETVLKMDKRNAWFWDIIADDSRFLVASHLSFGRTMWDAVAVLSIGQSRTETPPRLIISDGLAAYPDAVDRVFGADSQHIRSRGFTSEPNTNLTERFHGTLKQRTKVMRGMQNMETANLVMQGWLVHYNFFREHKGLDGKTPGEVAKVAYPWKSWGDVVHHGYIPTEQRRTIRIAR